VIITIDFDDVLAKTVEGWCEHFNLLINQDKQKGITKDQVTSWDLKKVLHKINPSIENPYLPFEQKNFFLNLEPHRGIDCLEELVEPSLRNQFKLYIATACQYGFFEKIKWLKKHLPWFNQKNLIFIQDKSLLKTDILFDDNPANFNAHNTVYMLKKQPWNQPGSDYHNGLLTEDHEMFSGCPILREVDTIREFVDTVKIYSEGYAEGCRNATWRRF
jgi:5'(3')-deoxyribonucleotidase